MDIRIFSVPVKTDEERRTGCRCRVAWQRNQISSMGRNGDSALFGQRDIPSPSRWTSMR